jgi:O-antigen/teichoic acid export membrane protein
MNRLVKNFYYVSLYQILVLLVPLVTAPYLARTLGPASLGIASYVSAVSSLVGSFALLGIYNYGAREAAYGSGDALRLTRAFWELMTIRAFLGVIGSIAYFVIATNSEYRLFFFLFYANLLANLMDITWLFVGLEDMRPVVIKNIAVKVLTVLGIFGLVRTNADTSIYVGLMAITTLAGNLSVYPQLRGVIGRPSVDWTTLWHHLRGSVQLFIPQIAVILYMQVGRVMLQQMTNDSRQVAFYDQAEKIVMIPLSLITSFSIVMMPRMASEHGTGNTGGVERYFRLSGRAALFLAVPMSVGIAGIAPRFIPWYLGPEFHPTSLAVIILSPLIVANSIGGVAGSQFLTATNQVRIMTIANSLAAVCNIGCNLILIPWLGAIGCALSVVIASCVSAIIQVSYVGRQTGIGELIRSAAMYLLFSVPVALGILGLGVALPGGPLTTVLQVLSGVVLYSAGLLIVKDGIMFGLINAGVTAWRSKVARRE